MGFESSMLTNKILMLLTKFIMVNLANMTPVKEGNS